MPIAGKLKKKKCLSKKVKNTKNDLERTFLSTVEDPGKVFNVLKE
jgi:hypothetical protein